MSAASGPGPILVDVDDLPSGWEAFATNNGDAYFCFPQVYYYCRESDKVQWEKPGAEDAMDDFAGTTINGKKPYEKGDEFIPPPPPPRAYEGPLSDANYTSSCEDPNDLFQPDEDMLEACLTCDMDKLKKALEDGADVSLPNFPWQNTPLHLANSPSFWDADTFIKEKQMRRDLSEYLIRQSANLEAENIFGCTPVDLAIFHHYWDTMQLINQEGVKKGWFGAAYANDFDRCQELLEEGYDIDREGRYGRTGFAEAHLRGSWVIESFLVQQGCSREIKHAENMKFNPGGGAIPRGNLVPKREKQYTRSDDPEWYDNMMEKRFPGYQARLKNMPKD